MQTNSTNLNQTDGGTLIKQGDTSSRFAYQLCDENGDIINLAGKQAKVSIGNRSELYLSKTVDVAEDNTVSFTIDSILPLGTHRVEVACSGYIFPSDRQTTITVKRSHEEYVAAEALERVHYDDTELREGLSEVSSKLAEQTETLSNLKASVNETNSDYGSRLQVLEAKPDFDPSPLEAKDRELEDQLSRLHNYDDSELRRKTEQQEQALSNMTQALGKGIVEVAVVNKLVYDMPGFDFYNTDASVKALASYLHDNRLDYSNANMREMSRVNHQDIVSNLSSASRGQGQKLTLTYQPKRLPDNFRLLAYTDQYRYDAVRSANYGGIGANDSHLAIFYIGTDPIFYVMHPKDKQVSLMTDYNDYAFGMVKSIKLQNKMEYNNRFSITKLMFRTDESIQNRVVEYKAVLQLID